MGYSIKGCGKEFQLTEDDYNFLLGQLKAKSMATLKNEMRKFGEQFGTTELKTLADSVVDDILND